MSEYRETHEFYKDLEVLTQYALFIVFGTLVMTLVWEPLYIVAIPMVISFFVIRNRHKRNVETLYREASKSNLDRTEATHEAFRLFNLISCGLFFVGVMFGGLITNLGGVTVEQYDGPSASTHRPDSANAEDQAFQPHIE